jgi:DNA-directed RNA polymerase specialized sigma24 family protein
MARIPCDPERSAPRLKAWMRPTVYRSARGCHLEELRQELTPFEQRLLALRVVHGLSSKEVAEVMSSGEEPLDQATVLRRYGTLKRKLERRARELGLLGDGR